jgi:hypothetical protein
VRTPGEAAADPTRILCQREFDPETAPSFYTAENYPRDTILPLSDDEIDRVTGWGLTQLPENVIFEARGVRVPIQAGTVLYAADQFVLSIIRHAWGDRPVYFAMTTNVHRNLGLGPHVARQGLAFRLMTPEEATAEGVVALNLSPTDPFATAFGAFVDVPRTRRLLWEEYVYRNLPNWSHWPDDATRGIPTYYAYTYFALAQAAQDAGNEDEAVRNLERGNAWHALAGR